MQTASPVAADDPRVVELEAVVRDLIAAYERLSALSQERQRAIRAADPGALGRVIGLESEAVQAVAALEQKRLPLVADLAKRLGAPARTETTITWIAQRLPGLARERLLSQAQRLRELISSVLKQNDTARRTAELLAGHMEGLMRQVAAALNHAQTYGRAGVVGAGPTVVSALDVRS